VTARSGIAVVSLATIMAVGCAGSHRRAPSPTLKQDIERLEAQMEVLPPFPTPVPESGSLWNDGGIGAALVRDPRAFQVNDLVTVVLQEASTGTNASTTDLFRSSGASYAVPFAFDIAGDDLAKLGFESFADSDFIGDGSTARSSRLAATVTTRVLRVLPNGDLVIAGQKNVVINREKQVLTLVGSVRPLDLSANNVVSSAEIGELTVRLWGSGEVDDNIRQGWFVRAMNRFWPF
jgi:flagellar L-ring protein precursor FlgH